MIEFSGLKTPMLFAHAIASSMRCCGFVSPSVFGSGFSPRASLIACDASAYVGLYAFTVVMRVNVGWTGGISGSEIVRVVSFAPASFAILSMTEARRTISFDAVSIFGFHSASRALIAFSISFCDTTSCITGAGVGAVFWRFSETISALSSAIVVASFCASAGRSASFERIAFTFADGAGSVAFDTPSFGGFTFTSPIVVLTTSRLIAGPKT